MVSVFIVEFQALMSSDTWTLSSNDTASTTIKVAELTMAELDWNSEWDIDNKGSGQFTVRPHFAQTSRSGLVMFYPTKPVSSSLS